MKEKPILFRTEMVRAILDGWKTQTRRPLKPQPIDYLGILCAQSQYNESDHLWVRETWYPMQDVDECAREDEPVEIVYKADFDADGIDRYEAEELGIFKWRSPLFMPKWVARLWLEVLDVRVERVQDTSGVGAVAEGFGQEFHEADLLHFGGYKKTKGQFQTYWNTIHKKKPEFQWEANPWVWMYKFRQLNYKR